MIKFFSILQSVVGRRIFYSLSYRACTQFTQYISSYFGLLFLYLIVIHCCRKTCAYLLLSYIYWSLYCVLLLLLSVLLVSTICTISSKIFNLCGEIEKYSTLKVSQIQITIFNMLKRRNKDVIFYNFQHQLIS